MILLIEKTSLKLFELFFFIRFFLSNKYLYESVF